MRFRVLEAYPMDEPENLTTETQRHGERQEINGLPINQPSPIGWAH